MKQKLVVAGLVLGSAAMMARGELRAEYRFETGTGSTAVDSSTNGFDAVITNPSWVTGVKGEGTALEFTGSSGASTVTVPPAVFDTVSNEVSIAVWSYGATNVQSDSHNMFYGGKNSNHGRSISCHIPYRETKKVYIYLPDVSYKTDNDQHWMGEWTLWVFTKNSDDGTIKTYLNGELWNQASGKYTQLAPTTSFNIGSSYTGGYYIGTVDEFQIYDHELSVAEIAQLYDPNLVVASIYRTPSIGEGPLTVTFDGSESFSGNGIVSYDWNFGDSNTASGVLATNVYMDEGSYTATLTVVDSAGTTNTTTASILVDSPSYSANAGSIVYTRNNWDELDVPTVSSNDLAQTTVLSYSTYSTYSDSQAASLSNAVSRVFDGVAAPSDVRMYVGDSITVEFDISGAPFGYDLTEITTTFGASVSSGGRANQGYDVITVHVDGSTNTMASWKYWNPNDPTTFWTGATLEEESGGAMISGVKAVTIKIIQPANPGGWIYVSEFDLFGTPTVLTVGPTLFSELVSGGLEISWESVGGALYSVQSTENLVSPSWATLPDYSSVPATPPMNIYTAAVDSATAEHFQVIIEN